MRMTRVGSLSAFCSRQRDVYRAWALIEPSNVASTRAFEKAAYVAVADVIHAKMAVVDKLVIRPPDPEAKRLLGIPQERLMRETISLGYPAEHLQPTPNPPGRRPLEQLVHWEHY